MTQGVESTEGVALSAAVRQVATELAQAVEAGRDSPVRFQLGSVELEFQVAVSHVYGDERGVRVSVIPFEAQSEPSRAGRQRVRMSLTVADNGERPLLISESGGGGDGWK
jgi:hypothetical protein